jgi:hypothetical protein
MTRVSRSATHDRDLFSSEGEREKIKEHDFSSFRAYLFFFGQKKLHKKWIKIYFFSKKVIAIFRSIF